MPDRHFPVRPNLEQLRHQAKDCSVLCAVTRSQLSPGPPTVVIGARR